MFEDANAWGVMVEIFEAVLQDLTLTLITFSFFLITYLTGELPTRASCPPCQDPTKTTTIHNSIAPSRTVIENCNRLFYLESTAVSCLHVRALCPASPQRLQRRWLGSPALMRTLLCLLPITTRCKLL
jgi:hypothetical protein